MIRVLIVAAYATVRAGLHVLISGMDGIAIVGEVSNSADVDHLLQGAPETRPQVILADHNPNDTLRLIEIIEANAGGNVGLVLLGEAREDYDMLVDTSLYGWAYLLREAEGEELVGAIHAAAAGIIALDRSLSSALLTGTETAYTEPLPEGDTLSRREHEVLQLMANGLPNKQIASHLTISLHTVKFHVASILAKLGAASRTEAVAVGARRGHVTL